MSRKKLYIDCQFFQTEVWDRGMGRYALSLIKALYKEEKDSEFVFIFSLHLPKNRIAVNILQTECQDAKIVELDLRTTKQETIVKAVRYNRMILEEFIEGDKDQGSEPLFLIPCLFQEPTVSIFPSGTHTSIVCYDAIPLLYYQRYRTAINYEAYLERYKTLYQARTIFTISQTIADDLAVYLGIEDGVKRKIINVDGAYNETMFVEFKKPQTDIGGEFILLPSSSDIRKNNHIAVRAFEQVRSLLQKDYKLVITSTFTKDQRKQLLDISPNVIFTDNINDDELSWLYKHATAVLFASEYEGLGLPVLESVKMGKPVACSNLSVFREISEEAFYYFNPLDVQEAALALSEAVSGREWKKKKSLYTKINAKYKWERSARLVSDGLTSNVGKKKETKPKVAICTPVPDGYSAVGKVVQELHALTSEYFEVDYYVENKKGDQKVSVRPDLLSVLAKCYPIEAFNAKTYKKYDAVIYHIGNSEYHFSIITKALHLPGIAVFHDTVLEEAYGEMVRLNFITPERMEIEANIDSMDASDKLQSKYITSVACNQVAVISHSQYAKNALQWVLRSSDTENIQAQLPVAAPERSVISQKRKKIHIGLGGVLTSNKGIDIIKKLASDDVIADDIVIHVFGFNFVDPTIADGLKVFKNVKLAVNLSDLEYQTQLQNLDILINFRHSYRGETSLTVLEAMRYGCVVIINGTLGWFSELPDDAVVKVGHQQDIMEVVRRMVSMDDERRSIGAHAQRYIHNKHNPVQYIEMLYNLSTKQWKTDRSKLATIIKESTHLSDILKALEERESV